MTRYLSLAAFLLGAIIVIWTGWEFVGSTILALAVTVIIAAVYSAGFAELWRYQNATTTLNVALNGLNSPIDDLDNWIRKLHPSLHNAVRLRIEGEHVGLPTPVVTPYLVGLLVMLGLLGTFIGMVDTLKGAVIALKGAAELEAIRAGLEAPIEGLGMAFGTSVAGVAASAMLGFVSTISRRERMLASRELDGKIITVFQHFSLAFNRKQTYSAMQQQAQALPQVAEQLTQLAQTLGHMSEDIGGKLVANQQQFHESVKDLYADLAQSVDQSLKTSLADSGRLAGESIQPIVEKVMQDISVQAQTTHERLTHTAEQQLTTLSERFANTSEQVSQSWQTSLSAHAQSSQAMIEAMNAALGGFSQQFEQSATSMLATFSQSSNDWIARQQADDQAKLEHWTTAFAQTQQQSVEQLQDTSSNYTQQLANTTQSYSEQLSQTSERYTQQLADTSEHYVEKFEKAAAQYHEQMSVAANAQMQQLTHSSQAYNEQLSDVSATQQQLAQSLQQSAESMSANMQTAAEKSLTEVAALLQSSEALVQVRIESEQRWNDGFDARIEKLSAAVSHELQALRSDEEARGEAAVARLSELQGAVTEHLSSLGHALEEPMTRLIQTASETPKAAAEVIEKLRSEISKNIERDNDLLQERCRIMEELNALSISMEQASSSQREAVEKMVNASSSMLKEVAAGFNEQVGGEVTKLTDMADHFAGSASEMASLGEAFSMAVQLFSDSNTSLIDKLNNIESALQHSTERSDEQLGYYVAQAREIIDHNMLSQQEVIEQLRQLSHPNDKLVTEAS